MKRYRQTVEEITGCLSPVDTSWRDDQADNIIERLQNISAKASYSRDDIKQLFDSFDLSSNDKYSIHFDAAQAIVRLFLDMSKDEFTSVLRERLGAGGIGSKRWQRDKETYCQALEEMGLLHCMETIINTPVTWSDILTERLKGGRGSAIKGQRRGRYLEDFVENIIIDVFGENAYDVRCQFRGATAISFEKADFAIQSKDDPLILIEVKAYGATGSKQTDILGDITRIVNEKRFDTHFLLVTDGVTWKDRLSDLRKLIDLQNQGKITRIYTQSMADLLRADLLQLKQEHGL